MKYTHSPHFKPSVPLLLQHEPSSQKETLGKTSHTSLFLLALEHRARFPRGGGMGLVPEAQPPEEAGETAVRQGPRCKPAQVAGP